MEKLKLEKKEIAQLNYALTTAIYTAESELKKFSWGLKPELQTRLYDTIKVCENVISYLTNAYELEMKTKSKDGF